MVVSQRVLIGARGPGPCLGLRWRWFNPDPRKRVCENFTFVGIVKRSQIGTVLSTK